MKKSILVLGTVVFLFASQSLMGQDSMMGQSSSSGTASGQGMMGGMMGQGGMMGMGGMCGMMMSNMMGKSMVATTDGGVIVSVGNKLYKYDKDLKLVKEAEFTIDMQQMQKMMQNMMEQCPMGGQGTGSVHKSTGAATGQHGH